MYIKAIRIVDSHYEEDNLNHEEYCKRFPGGYFECENCDWMDTTIPMDNMTNPGKGDKDKCPDCGEQKAVGLTR